MRFLRIRKDSSFTAAVIGINAWANSSIKGNIVFIVSKWDTSMKTLPVLSQLQYCSWSWISQSITHLNCMSLLSVKSWVKFYLPFVQFFLLSKPEATSSISAECLVSCHKGRKVSSASMSGHKALIMLWVHLIYLNNKDM